MDKVTASVATPPSIVGRTVLVLTAAANATTKKVVIRTRPQKTTRWVAVRDFANDCTLQGSRLI